MNAAPAAQVSTVRGPGRRKLGIVWLDAAAGWTARKEGEWETERRGWPSRELAEIWLRSNLYPQYTAA